MLFGRSITLWTARLSMALLAVGFSLLLRRGGGHQKQEAVRLIWTIACAVLVLHVAAAFQYVHHWSNADAVRAASDQTRQFLGFGVGGGIYAGYAFLLLWILDVSLWWAAPSWRERRPAVRSAVIAIAAFMAFNAAVVFAPRLPGGSDCSSA